MSVECENCGEKIHITWDDITWGIENYVICPICGEKVDIFEIYNGFY